jgi:hypothetical protein
MVASHPMLTIYSLETTLIVASSHWKQFACFWPTKLNTQRTFSFSEEIMSVLQLIEFTGSMMSANAVTTSSSGKLSLTVSIAFLLLLLLMRKFSACTVD